MLRDITLTNKYVCKLENEPHGFINKSNLEFAISEFKHNKRLSNYKKIAVLVRGIAQGHVFIDGNKRTAFIVLQTLLNNINLKFDLSKRTVENFIIRVAKGKYNNLSLFEAYLRRNTKKK